MPIYLYQHPETEEVIEIVQKMSDFHIYIDYDGVEWNRKWTLPNAQIDADVDPFDKAAFSRKIDQSGKGTVGDLWDRSQELSEKRKNKLGYDPVKKKNLEKYSKDRMGRKPPTIVDD